MNLRTKTFLIIAITIICAFMILAVLLGNFIRNGYEREEYQLTNDKLQQSESAINITIDNLLSFAKDWATWDDTYKFAQDRNEEYIKRNLMDATFIDNRFNLIAVVNSRNEIVYVQTFNLLEEEAVQVPEELLTYLTKNSPLINNIVDTEGVTGIISLPDAPMMIVSNPIFTSDQEGPSQGAFLVGRYLDSYEINRISNDFHLSILGLKIDDPQKTEDFKLALTRLSSGESTFILPIDDNTIAGYRLLLDVNKQPAMIIKSSSTRPLYAQSRTDILGFTIALFALGLLFILLIWFILEKWVLSRIAILSQDVNKVDLSKDDTSRINLPGKDELSNLAKNINDMLDKLEKTKKLQKGSETFNEALLKESPNPIEVLNQDGSIRYVNPALERLTGYSQQQLIGRKQPFPWWFSDNNIQFNSDLTEDMVEGVHKRERHLRKQNGDSFWVEITSVSVTQEDGTKFLFSNWVDITERKNADLALRESELRFRELAELLPELVFEVDLQGKIKFVNKVAFSVFGYLPKDYLDMGLINFVAREDKEKVKGYLQSVVSNQEIENIEFTAIRKDDRRFPAVIHAAVITNAIQQATGLRGIIVDITSQKKIEAQLRASEEFSTSLLTNASHPIIVVNPDTSIQYINPAMAALTGFSSSEVIGLKKPYPWWPKNGLSENIIENNTSINNEVIGQERSYQKKGGEQFWVTLTITPIKENCAEKYLLENWVDITERKRVEDALRESEEFSTSLRDSSPYPIMVINPDLSIRYVNLAFEKITGYTSVEMVGQLPPYKFWSEQQIPSLKNKYSRSTPSSYKSEENFQAKDGKTFWVDITSTPIMEGLNLKYTLSIWIDITSQKLANDQLDQLYRSEKNLREALQTEIRGRTEFTRALVHELKTPLTPIMVSSELLVDELKNEPLIGLAKNIHKGAQNLNKRVDELLDMARGEVGILKINMRPVDPEILLKDVIKYVEPASRSGGQSLVLHLPNKLPIITADEDRIRQVLLNLINNSIKYSNGEGTITVSAKEDEDNLVFEIQDTGRGMSEEEQEKLFQPYYRIEGKQHLSGLGLGLVLSKQLVELHKGRIWLKSEKGVGSIFYFSIPLQNNTNN
jgi:PAS domain S-box-containing protein